MDGFFESDFIADLRWWIVNDSKTADFILELVEATMESPRYGIGDPHFMKDRGIGFWSRIINRDHLLIYVHCGSYIRFLQCRTVPTG
jgi:Txe/YoeB family toxin of toxin-antitoxin system